MGGTGKNLDKNVNAEYKMIKLPWQKGRQNSGYEKIKIFSSKLLGCDFYLLRFPKGVSVPTHTDPVELGLKHHRINLHFGGKNSNCVGQRMYVLGKHTRFWRIVYLRPDTYSHGLPAQNKTSYMLSFGWVTKLKVK